MRDRYVPGPQGPEGERGERGKSAYDLARDAGFRGSLEQWLASLRGPAGSSGAQGADGAPGQRGVDGASSSALQLPIRADFIRDDITDLTLQVLVLFPDTTVSIIPERDDRGFMTGATFS